MTKTTLWLAIVALGTLAGIAAGHAQTYYDYPWCAAYSDRTKNCGFKTFEQCLATISGVGGFCEPSPRYRPPAKSTRRKTTRG